MPCGRCGRLILEMQFTSMVSKQAPGQKVIFPHSIVVIGFPTSILVFFCFAPQGCGKEPLRSVWVVGFCLQPGFPNTFLLGCFLRPLAYVNCGGVGISRSLLFLSYQRNDELWGVRVCILVTHLS